jgi:anti-sigma B factor antagonist
MTALLKVSTDLVGDTAVVHAIGEVDMSSAPTLRAELFSACDEVSESGVLAVDLTGVVFLGSSGVSALLQAYGRCQIEGIPLRIVATNTAVLRTLELCGVVGVLDIRDSLADATRTQAA